MSHKLINQLLAKLERGEKLTAVEYNVLHARPITRRTAEHKSKDAQQHGPKKDGED
jgi:hypothetical protein